ncbi:hypothetical protein [Lentzea sp. NPDC092896]|uniref:hypothetical protein n=1 Tax=Lentzea sp. NPDC092896 TaxID=3364127 RepID=UPI0037F7F93D
MAEVNVSGPIFDGRADLAAGDYVDAARHAVARQAKANVSMLLDRYLKHPTPYYETQMHIDSGDPDVVKNHVKLYGPWLEGTGSRNSPKTRFKGYGHWREATKLTQAEATRVAQSVLPPFLEAMGG